MSAFTRRIALLLGACSLPWAGVSARAADAQDTVSVGDRFNALHLAPGFAVAIWHNGEMAGQIEYNYLDWINRKTEIGYWLGESFETVVIKFIKSYLKKSHPEFVILDPEPNAFFWWMMKKTLFLERNAC